MYIYLSPFRRHSGSLALSLCLCNGIRKAREKETKNELFTWTAEHRNCKIREKYVDHSPVQKGGDPQDYFVCRVWGGCGGGVWMGCEYSHVWYTIYVLYRLSPLLGLSVFSPPAWFHLPNGEWRGLLPKKPPLRTVGKKFATKNTVRKILIVGLF